MESSDQPTIKLIDFGSSCYENETIYTYIQSRFYRAPEVILGNSYGHGIDMWSLGCILSELHTGYPIFPGEDETEQIQCMMEILGIPPRSVIETASRQHKFFDENFNPICTANSRGKKRRPNGKDLSSACQTTDRLFLDFISKCLDWDPSTRMQPHEALKHPWIAGAASGRSSRRHSRKVSRSTNSQRKSLEGQVGKNTIFGLNNTSLSPSSNNGGSGGGGHAEPLEGEAGGFASTVPSGTSVSSSFESTGKRRGSMKGY